ncbi:MAG: hypothetical protein ACLP1X_06565 [Polyangiaceae bacterium]
MEPATTRNETNTRHANQAKKWALVAIELGIGGALIGAVLGRHFRDEYADSTTPVMLGAFGLGGLGLVVGLIPSAWFLFLVMLGQIASALRKD